MNGKSFRKSLLAVAAEYLLKIERCRLSLVTKKSSGATEKVAALVPITNSRLSKVRIGHTFSNVETQTLEGVSEFQDENIHWFVVDPST